MKKASGVGFLVAGRGHGMEAANEVKDACSYEWLLAVAVSCTVGGRKSVLGAVLLVSS